MHQKGMSFQFASVNCITTPQTSLKLEQSALSKYEDPRWETLKLAEEALFYFTIKYH